MHASQFLILGASTPVRPSATANNPFSCTVLAATCKPANPFHLLYTLRNVAEKEFTGDSALGEQKPEKPSARSSSNTGRGHSWEGRGATAQPLPRQPPQAARPAAVARTQAEAKLARRSQLCIIPAGEGRQRWRQLVQELQGRRRRTARRLTPAGQHWHLLCIIASAGWLGALYARPRSRMMRAMVAPICREWKRG